MRGLPNLAAWDFQNLFPSPDVRPRHDDLPVEPSGAEEGRVENVGAVGGRHDYDALVRFEPVHLYEELVERLLPFVVSAAEPRTAVTPYGVELVDEYDAGGVALGLNEEVPHAGCADADEHFDEVAAADNKERDARFAGDCLGEEGFTRSGRAHEQDALGNPAAELGELFGALKEFDDFLDFFLGLVDSGHVLERDFILVFGEHARAVLAEGHRLRPARLKLAHEDDHYNDEKHERGPVKEHVRK